MHLKSLSELSKHSYLKKIVVIFFIITSFLIAITAYDMFVLYRSAYFKIRSESDNVAQSIQFQITNVFLKIDLALEEMVTEIGTRKNLEEWTPYELAQIASRRRKFVPEAEQFFVVREDGYDLVKRSFGNMLQLKDRDYFYRQASSIDNKIFFSRPVLSRDSGKVIVVASKKLVNEKGDFKGIVAVGIPLTYFSTMNAELSLSTGTLVSLYNVENVLYYMYPWEEKRVGEIIPHQRVYDEIFVKKNPYIIEEKTGGDGVGRVSAARRIGPYDFFVTVSGVKSEYFKEFYFHLVFYFVFFTIYFVGCYMMLKRVLNLVFELEEQKKLSFQRAKITSLGDMAGGIAHEINNPLTIIHGKTIQLIQQLDEDSFDSTVFRSNLEKIHNTSSKLRKIVKSLKSFSSPNEKEPLEEVYVENIIDYALELCGNKFDLAKINLAVDPIPELKIKCRESQIVQVLLNLLLNAFEAVQKLETKWVRVSVEIYGDNILFKITDSGLGIPDNILKNIMQPFFSTKEASQGTGLGLSISKGIVEEHAGTLYIDTESFNTCFVVKLPIS